MKAIVALVLLGAAAYFFLNGQVPSAPQTGAGPGQSSGEKGNATTSDQRVDSMKGMTGAVP